MKIHTLVNSYNIKLSSNIIIWNNDNILELINNKFPLYLNYYNNLWMSKSRENFARLLILKTHGGLYINYYLLLALQTSNNDYTSLIDNISEVIFFTDIHQHIILRNIFENITILSDDIFYFKNVNDSIINILLNNIDYDIVPDTEYQNKLHIGSIYITKQLEEHIYFFGDESKIIIKKPIDVNYVYRKQIYLDVPDMRDPTDELIYWNNLYILVEPLITSLIILLSDENDYTIILNLLLIKISIDLIILQLTKMRLSLQITKATINNNIFYNPRKFNKIIQNNWQIIKNESNIIFNNNDIEVNYIYDKDNSNDSDIYGFNLYYYGTQFESIIKLCPQTWKLIEKIKDQINVCRFRCMKSSSIIKSNKKLNNLKCLSYHLGLTVPHSSACKLLVNKNNEFTYQTENEGKIIIFDNNNEYIEYNQSCNNCIILYIEMKSN